MDSFLRPSGWGLVRDPEGERAFAALYRNRAECGVQARSTGEMTDTIKCGWATRFGSGDDSNGRIFGRELLPSEQVERLPPLKQRKTRWKAKLTVCLISLLVECSCVCVPPNLGSGSRGRKDGG